MRMLSAVSYCEIKIQCYYIQQTRQTQTLPSPLTVYVHKFAIIMPKATVIRHHIKQSVETVHQRQHSNLQSGPKNCTLYSLQ